MEFSEVYAVTAKYARKCFGRDDDRVSLALVLAWWAWQQRKEDFPAGVYARAAVRHVYSGRDLPGVKQGKFRDIWDRLTRWQGAAMQYVIDRRPGPERQAVGREALAQLRRQLSPGQAAMLDEVEKDWGQENRTLAARLGVSPARVSQMRREIMARAEE